MENNTGSIIAIARRYADLGFSQEEETNDKEDGEEESKDEPEEEAEEEEEEEDEEETVDPKDKFEEGESLSHFGGNISRSIMDMPLGLLKW